MKTALLVEDNDLYREEIRDLLSSRFPLWRILEAADGAEALDALQRYEPQVVFMDIALPGEDGLSLTRKIKQEHPNITVAILSSYDFPEYREAAQESGADLYLVKGLVSPVEIIAVIEELPNCA